MVKFHRRIFGLIFVSFDRKSSPQFGLRFLGESRSGSLSELDEVLINCGCTQLLKKIRGPCMGRLPSSVMAGKSPSVG